MSDLFQQATRNKWRWNTPKGALSVEQLWELPLTTQVKGNLDLDGVAQATNKELKESAGPSFVKKTNAAEALLQKKLDLVVEIINIKMAEVERAQEMLAKQHRKAELLAALQSKQAAALLQMSEADIQRELAGL